MTVPSNINPPRRRAAQTSLRATLACGLVSIAIACSEPAPPPPPPAPPAPVNTAETRAQRYQDCWGYYNNKAWDQFQTCYTENAVSEAADSATPVTSGRAAIIDRDKQEITTFSDRRGELKLVLSHGPHVASVALWTATNDGAMPPGPDGKAMPATNKKVGLLMAHIVEFDATGMQVTRDTGYFEEGTMLAQLGVLKQPARPVMAPTGTAATVVIARNDAAETANLAAARAMVETFNKHDLKGLEATMADNYKLIEIGQSADKDKKGAVASTKEFFAGFPDVTSTPTSTWAAGDYVVIEGSISGTNKGPLPSMGLTKATGKTVKGRFFEILKYENGKIIEDWLFYNGAAFAAQLGLK